MAHLSYDREEVKVGDLLVAVGSSVFKVLATELGDVVCLEGMTKTSPKSYRAYAHTFQKISGQVSGGGSAAEKIALAVMALINSQLRSPTKEELIKVITETK